MEANSKKILSLQKIYKSYEANVVIDNFSFDVDYGESVGLFGKNGCGKSSILKILVSFELENRRDRKKLDKIMPKISQTRSNSLLLPCGHLAAECRMARCPVWRDS